MNTLPQSTSKSTTTFPKHKVTSKPTESFNELAKRIRYQKVNKEEIQKLKNESIYNSRQRAKKANSAIKIQKVYRGFLFRKQFQTTLDALNIQTVITYLNDKHKERITTNATSIISKHINDFILKKQKQRNKILTAYFNYCASIIQSMYISFKVRSRLKPIRDLVRSKKEIINKHIQSFKVRMILRVNSIQNTLLEIANIRCSLNADNSNNNSNSNNNNTQLQNDLNKRLHTLYMNIYDSYYDIKHKRSYVEMPRTDNKWYIMYLSLLYKDNKTYQDAAVNMKNPIIKTKSAKIIAGNNNFDDKPIMPIKEVTEQEDKPITNDKPNNPYEDYENKPIKVKQIDYEHIFEDQPPIDVMNSSSNNNNVSSNKKKRVHKSPSKKPKYDARKAIEEAKQRDIEQQQGNNSMKKDKKNGFRDFIKEIKTNSITKPSPINDTISSVSNLEQSSSLQVKSTKNSNNTNNNRTSLDPRQSRRKEPIEIAMRRKLHELERSPPPKLNIHNVKSKVSCWGDSSRQNTNTVSNVQSLNIRRIKKNDLVKDEQNNKFNVNDLVRIENSIKESTVRNKVENLFEHRDNTLKQFNRIPRMMVNSSCVKEFSLENYEEITNAIIDKYKELNNQN